MNEHPEWRERARCRTEHWSIYDTSLLPESSGRRMYAHKLCHGCPVLEECAIDAIQTDTRGVVRAGYPFPDDQYQANLMRREVGKRFGVQVPNLPVLRERSAEDVPVACVHGHRFEDGSFSLRKSDGARICLVCRRERWARVDSGGRRERRRAGRGVAA